MNENLDTYLELSKKIAQNAGKILLEGQEKGFFIDYKGKSDLVTEIDKKSEQYIVGELRKAFPNHSILGEEGSNETHDPDYRWIIDPIDGTTNYAHGHPYYCISIGLEIKGEMAIGTVFAPVFNEMFSAAKGLGAFLNEKPLKVSTIKTLEPSLLGTGFNPSAPDLARENMTPYMELQDKSHGIRRCGAAALDICYVAAGRLDGFWEKGLKAWDMAGGKIIVEEAGGTITALNGNPFNVDKGEILASNGKIHQEMVDYFNALR